MEDSQLTEMIKAAMEYERIRVEMDTLVMDHEFQGLAEL